MQEKIFLNIIKYEYFLSTTNCSHYLIEESRPLIIIFIRLYQWPTSFLLLQINTRHWLSYQFLESPNPMWSQLGSCFLIGCMLWDFVTSKIQTWLHLYVFISSHLWEMIVDGNSCHPCLLFISFSSTLWSLSFSSVSGESASCSNAGNYAPFYLSHSCALIWFLNENSTMMFAEKESHLITDGGTLRICP